MSKAPPLQEIYRRLYAQFGPQHWWPAQTRFEVMVGAILTQNTNWGNVERAIRNLKRAQQLTPLRLKKISPAHLAKLIKPAGYFNVKVKRLKNFIDFLFSEYRGDLGAMSRETGDVLRKKLLNVNGIGPETADSILLYAMDKPVFVVDAYTKRFLSRHNWVDPNAGYDAIQNVFLKDLPSNKQMFNEYHALIVRLGKELCTTNPRCEICPLNNLNYSLKHRCYSCHRSLFRVPERYYKKTIVQGDSVRLLLCKECYDD